MKSKFAFGRFGAEARRKGALALCLALCTLGPGLSANGQGHKATIITFDGPGAGTGRYYGTEAWSINPAGVITGFISDASNVRHGYVRAPDGTITTFDAPGAGASNFQGTRAYSINPAGAITGWYSDASNVAHGYVRARGGAITTFDVPGAGGAGTASLPGTFAQNINPAGAIAGFYTDANDAFHGYVRAPDGTITTFDCPGAGASSGQGTFTAVVDGLNPAGVITGYSVDSNNVAHGFVRAPDGTITTFDPSGSTFTLGNGINPAGAVTGYYGDASGVAHGFLRVPDGTITTFDVPGAGTGAGQGTGGFAINPAQAITGYSVDINNVLHGFVRARDGAITTFDAPGAGTSPGQGTYFVNSINPAGAIAGTYLDVNFVFHAFLRTP